MRLIDADTAKAFSELCFGDIFLQTAVKTLLDKTPTVDAVPVVRCKDCVWFGQNNDGNWTGCAIEAHCTEDYPKPEDYCSFGERKDNGI